jgi:Ca2+-binding RTX toxin-like protein
MRKTILVVASVAVAMLVAGGVAWAATIRCHGGLCKGTPKADTMYGRNVGDAMYGRKGGDTMYGRGGLDALRANEGLDKVYGGSETDRMRGGPGADKLFGGPGGDGGVGNTGVDRIYGGPGRDGLSGGEGEFRFSDVSDDYIHGGKEADSLYGSRDTFIHPDEGTPLDPYRDNLQLGVDRFYGERGNDSIHVEANLHREGPDAKDVVDCGPGFDEVWFDPDVDVIKNCEVKHPFSYPSQ